jgi:hypothetical protein
MIYLIAAHRGQRALKVSVYLVPVDPKTVESTFDDVGITLETLITLYTA